MRYPEFRQNKLLVGSGGVIKAGCQTVIGSRLTKAIRNVLDSVPCQRDHRPPLRLHQRQI